MIDKPTKKRRLSFLTQIRRAFIFTQKYTDTVDKIKFKSKGPRGGSLYLCPICKILHPKSKIEVDHNPPVTPFDKYQYDLSEEEVINNIMYNDCQALCKDCHKTKSASDMILRRAAKKNK
jgi:hypothetical protein